MEQLHVQGTPFVAVPLWVLDRLDAATLRLYVILLSYGSPGKPVAFPAQDTLAARMSLSTRAVRSALTALQEAGCVRVEHRFARADGPRSNLYVLAWDQAFEPEAKPDMAEAIRKSVERVEPGRPTDSPNRDLGMTDQIEGLLAKLYDVDPKWQTLSVDPSSNRHGYQMLKRLTNKWGVGTVTLALGQASEAKMHIQGEEAYGVVYAICKRMATADV